MRSRRTKALDISKRVKDAVWERDGHACIICGSRAAMPNAHYIARSHGGLGIEQNIVTLCMGCHHAYDNSDKRGGLGNLIRQYLEENYKDWDETKLYYKKEEA